jgi:hypothetical protein
MKKIIIVKAGNTFESMASHLGDFEDWIFMPRALK